MKGTMKAWFVTGPGKMEMREVPIPEIGPKDILFKISYAAICGGDHYAYHDNRYLQKLPITIGHEFCGYVVEAGSEVKDIPVGMRFMGTNIQWCGECPACKSGNFFACDDVTRMGLGFGVDGVFAEYSVLHNAMLNVSVYPLPDNVNDRDGALCEPFCVGAGITDLLNLKDGDNVVIYGAGIIGQSMLQTIKAQYPNCKVAMVNRSKFRLELAKISGADYLISPTAERPAYDQLKEIFGLCGYTYHYGDNTEALNVDCAVDCAGSSSVIAECFKIAKNYGKVALVAGYGDEQTAPIHPADIFFKALTVIPGLGGNFAKSVQYMSEGKFKPDHLVTHVFPLEQLDKAFEAADSHGNSCKVVIKVDPNAPDYPYNKQN